MFRSLTDRILFFFCALLVTVQLIAFWVVNQTNQAISLEQFDRESRETGKLVKGFLDQQRQQLQQDLQKLAASEKYKASGYTNSNSGLDFALALSREGLDTPNQLTLAFNGSSQLQQWLASNSAGDSASSNKQAINGFIEVDNRLYQVVATPLHTNGQQWLAGGLALDEDVIADIEQLINAEVRFVTNHSGDIQVSSEMLADGSMPEIVVPVNAAYPNQAVAIKLPLQSGPAVYQEQRITLLLLAAFSLFISLLAGYAIAHEITRPLKRLNRVAQKIRAGDYSQGIAVKQNDELGQLAESIHYMSEGVAEREAKILELAYADTLTTLPNRAMFNDRLAQAVTLGQRTDKHFTILLIDLDRFKYINDVLGHESGDLVLQEVARRLNEVLRESDTVARLGGDEFAILLHTGISDRVMTAVHKIDAALSLPVILDNQPVDIGCSIGIARFPEHGDDASTLMRRADIAMYSAKRFNTGYAFYDPDCEQHQQEHLSLLGEIKRAVEKDEFQLFFQPKVCLDEVNTVAVETLLRWQHPEQGLIPPEEFIPFAERTGAIRMITGWVVKKAVAQCSEWQLQGLQVKMSLNISARDLLDPNLPVKTAHALAAHKVCASSLCFEITESALMEDPVRAHQVVTQLSEMGIEISIDDYGTGYSSLAYVKKLPIHELKIDREFVSNMLDNQQDVAIVRSTIELGHNLGLKVVAEGIENEDELEMLREFGCDQVQGFLISKALAAGEFEQWMQEQKADKNCLADATNTLPGENFSSRQA